MSEPTAQLLDQAIEELGAMKADVERRISKAYQSGCGNGQAQYRAEIRELRTALMAVAVIGDADVQKVANDALAGKGDTCSGQRS